MDSRGFDFFATRAEVLEVLQAVHSRRPFQGFAELYNDHSVDYPLLHSSELEEYFMLPSLHSIFVREVAVDAKWLDSEPWRRVTVEGLVQFRLPQIHANDVLTCLHIGMRDSDRDPKYPSPLPLFQDLKKEFKKLRRGKLYWRRDLKIAKGWSYSEGALSLFDAGYSLCQFNSSTNSVIPEERLKVEEDNQNNNRNL